MRSRSLLLVSSALAFAGCTETAYVQSPPPAPAAPVYASEPPPPPEAGQILSPLEQLCAPIALYPDPLLSLLLPAATFPDQIQAAAGYLQQGGDPARVDQMPWDGSVRGLSHYPTVVEWMGANRDWTSQLGGAFASQPAAVMDAIQELRRQAQAVGALTDTPQQQVVVVQDAVQIVPAQPDVIYVPQYDPAIVYVQQPYGYNRAAFFGWSRPYACGVWLSYDFDWHRHAVYTGDWYHYHQANGWRRPVDYGRLDADVRIHSRGWEPPRNAPPPPPQLEARRGGERDDRRASRFAQPRPMAGAPRPAQQQPRHIQSPAQQPAQQRQPAAHQPGQLHPLNDPRRPAQPQKPQDAQQPHPARQLKPLPQPDGHRQPQPPPGQHPQLQSPPPQRPVQHFPVPQHPVQHPQPPPPQRPAPHPAQQPQKAEPKQPASPKQAPDRAPDEHQRKTPPPDEHRPEPS